MRLDDDIDELELRRECIKAVGHTQVVPYDAHEVVTDMAFLAVKVRVVRVVRHHRRGVVQYLPDIVPPRICIFAVLVWVHPPSIHVYLPAQVDQPPDALQETRVRRRAVVVPEYLPLMRLAERDVHDAHFVCVDDGEPVEHAEQHGQTRRVDHLAAPLPCIAHVRR